jgi:hypothetical protein
VSGDFTQYKGGAVGKLVRLTSTGTLSALSAAAPDQPFLSMATDGTSLWGSRWFQTVAGVSSKFLVRLKANGTAATTFAMGFATYAPSSLRYLGGNFWAVGRMDTFQGLSSNGVTKIDPSAAVDPDFVATNFGTTGEYNQPYDADFDGTSVVLAGVFGTYRGVGSNYGIVWVDPATGARVGGFDRGLWVEVYSAQSRIHIVRALPGGKVFVSGWFSGVGSDTTPYGFLFDASTKALVRKAYP